MSNMISWPLTPATFGGVKQIEERVRISQGDSGAGSFALAESAGRQVFKVEFWRNISAVKLEFHGAGLNGLGLFSASVRTLTQPGMGLSIMLRRGNRGNGRIGVAYDDDRGCMVAFDPHGYVESLALPFNSDSLDFVPQATKQVFAMEACSLASAEVLLLLALGRGSDQSVAEAMEILEDLRSETEAQYDEMVTEHGLQTGNGKTKLRLNPGHSRFL
jgi:hypothetical protein